ncbi:MAG: methyl-accepting chemotaxis protein [Deltaproteobacteria bacterium]|nr:methyl-accepting chemotaxis protein [Deltaproteobacteria bacterium]
MLKNLKLSGKLWGLTIMLLLAVLLVAGNSICSIRDILSANKKYAGAADANIFMVQKEVDHLNWVKKVQELFMENGVTLDVQLDPTKCGLGKFLGGEKGRKLAQSDPKLAGLLEAIKEPHNHVHESGEHIKDVWQQIHPGLNLTLAARLDDHRRWAANVSNALLENREIDAQMDPGKCGFGKWLAGDESKKLVALWPEFGAIIQKVKEHHKRLHESVARINAAATEEEKKKIFFQTTLPELASVAGLFQKAVQLEDARNGAQKEAKHIFEAETLPALKITQGKMKALAHQLREMKKSSEEEMASTGTRSEISSIIFTAAAFILGIFLSFFLIRSITKPINRTITGLNEGADQVASASSQVSAASQSLAEGSSEQAASLEETSASLEEMSSMTKQAANNSTQADGLMEKANHIIEEANRSMAELTQSMDEISHASEETSKIIKTIDEIAFQTNLLALNAAVEAARAGEAGAGFAVVADEVRNLALRAAEAAKNTAELIDGTVKKVNSGTDLVAKTNTEFTRVAESATKVGELVSEISAASKEQAQGINEVNTAVSEMDKVTQQNAANAEESAAASEEMNAQAQELKGYVSELMALVGGKGGHTTGHGGEGRGEAVTIKRATPGKVKALAAPNRKQNTKKVTPEEIFPLDGKDFNDF